MNLVTQLRDIVGSDHVLVDAGASAPYLTDWRKRYHGTALAVVRPATTQEVARVVAACAATGTPMLPQGGNTGLVGGSTPDAGGKTVLISLLRMNRVRAVDRANDTITVEAGCILAAVQDAARAHDRLFPLSLAAEGTATIGGNLGTNAGGTQVLRYGNTRELTLGLEVVLASGEIWDGLRGLRKDNTGYDLKQLFIGSEGTLGVITAATLKLFPLPRAQVTAFAALPTLHAAARLLDRARAGAGATLTAFEVMSVGCVQRAIRELPRLRAPMPLTSAWYALLELSDHESEAHAAALLETILGAAIESGEVEDSVVAASLDQSKSLWQVREGIPEAHAKAGGNVKHDISLPVSAIPDFVEATNAELAARFPWIEPAVFGHLGDGNLHYNMGTQSGTPLAVAFEREKEINAIVHAAVARRAGSISAEHGVGQLKRDVLPEYKPGIELSMMRRIKQALDPQGLMNPGKVL